MTVMRAVFLPQLSAEGLQSRALLLSPASPDTHKLKEQRTLPPSVLSAAEETTGTPASKENGAATPTGQPAMFLWTFSGYEKSFRVIKIWLSI